MGERDLLHFPPCLLLCAAVKPRRHQQSSVRLWGLNHEPGFPSPASVSAVSPQRVVALFLLASCTQPGLTRTPEPTAPRDQSVVLPRSGFPVSLEGAANPSSEGSSADFGLEEFPHFPADAIVRISTPLGAGSGFIFLTREDTAYVMTNAHVVDVHSSITVRVRNAEEYDAVFLGGDTLVDISVLSMCCSDSFEQIPLGEGLTVTNPVPWSDNAGTAWVGDPLVVVGYPRGSYDLVATSGKIHTYLDTASGRLVVHDAIAEPGNSGSPILSPEGRLMGVHTAGSVWGEEVFLLGAIRGGRILVISMAPRHRSRRLRCASPPT